MIIYEHDYDTFRLKVPLDHYADNPRDGEYQITGFVKIPGAGDSRLVDVPAVHDDVLSLRRAHERFEDALYDAGRHHDDYRALVQRYARIFYGTHVEYDHEHGGYWFCNAPEFEANFPAAGEGKVKRFHQKKGSLLYEFERYLQDKLECEREVIAQERETYRQWAEGGVYSVVMERPRYMTRATYNAEEGVFEVADPLTKNDMEIDWEETTESLWGVYLSDDYTPAHVALDYFELTNPEVVRLQREVVG